MDGQFRVLPGSTAAGLLSESLPPGEMSCSLSAEYQACRRLEVDVADGHPFHLDIVEATIGLCAPAALELTVLLQIVSAPLGRLSSVVHP